MVGRFCWLLLLAPRCVLFQGRGGVFSELVEFAGGLLVQLSDQEHKVGLDQILAPGRIAS